MPTLAQIASRHGGVLVIDAASAVVHAGVWRAGLPPCWSAREGDSNRALFACVADSLALAGLDAGDVGAFVFCEGPGSMLGLRTAAMAIRTWQAIKPRPAFRYQSLRLVANELVRRGTAPPFAVVADARRDLWHTMMIEATGGLGALRRLSAAEVAAFTGSIWTPAGFRFWSRPPCSFLSGPYDLPLMLAAASDVDLLTEIESPDVFQHEDPSYRRWMPGVHRANTSASDPP